jgi:hypothetical protein
LQSGLDDVRYFADLLQTCDEEDLDALVRFPQLFAQIGAPDPQSLLTDAKQTMRARGQIDQFSKSETAAAKMIREGVAAGFTVFGGRSPRQEISARIREGAMGIATALLLRTVDVAAFRRLWGPYRFHLPFLMVFEHKWAKDARVAGAPEQDEAGDATAGQTPTVDEIQKHVLFVLEYDMRVDDPAMESSLRDDYGFDDAEVSRLIDDALAEWFVKPLMAVPSVIAEKDIQTARTVGDVVALIAASFGHDVSPTFESTSTPDRFGPQTDAVFGVLRAARWLPLHAGRTFHQQFQGLSDPDIKAMRSAMAEAMWAARRNGRAQHVKEARRLVDRAASRSVTSVHSDNLSYEAMEQGSSAGQFAIMAVIAAATKDLIASECYLRLTDGWQSVVDG